MALNKYDTFEDGMSIHSSVVDTTRLVNYDLKLLTSKWYACRTSCVPNVNFV